MNDFFNGVYFMINLIILLILQFGSYTSGILVYDSKNANPYVKWGLTIIFAANLLRSLYDVVKQ